MSSIAACASRWYSPTDASWSSGQIATRRVGRAGWLARIGRPRETCIESAETSSAGMRSAIASATEDFPDAVGPKMPRTAGSGNEPLADAVELGLRHAARPEVGGNASVAPLQLLQHGGHRLCGGRGA